MLRRVFAVLVCVGDHFAMTSTACLTVHLVVRRHVDYGMTRSAMCMSA
jgi:hypothetical protein